MNTHHISKTAGLIALATTVSLAAYGPSRNGTYVDVTGELTPTFQFCQQVTLQRNGHCEQDNYTIKATKWPWAEAGAPRRSFRSKPTAACTARYIPVLCKPRSS